MHIAALARLEFGINQALCITYVVSVPLGGPIECMCGACISCCCRSNVALGLQVYAVVK
jgi:hypothetical protein